jgi:hypothetical protein
MVHHPHEMLTRILQTKGHPSALPQLTFPAEGGLLAVFQAELHLMEA